MVGSLGRAPSKGVVAGSGRAVGVDLQVLEAERCLDVISSQRGQCAPQRVPCMHAGMSHARSRSGDDKTFLSEH